MKNDNEKIKLFVKKDVGTCMETYVTLLKLGLSYDVRVGIIDNEHNMYYTYSVEGLRKNIDKFYVKIKGEIKACFTDEYDYDVTN